MRKKISTHKRAVRRKNSVPTISFRPSKPGTSARAQTAMRPSDAVRQVAVRTSQAARSMVRTALSSPSAENFEMALPAAVPNPSPLSER